MIDFNPSSSAHISALLFGGDIKYTEKEETGVIKTGKNAGYPKFKNHEKIKHLEGLIKPQKSWTTATGKLSTNEAVLAQIANKKGDAAEIASIMLSIRFLEKQLRTYYNGIETLIEEFDSCVHGQLCHCGYETGVDSFGGGTATGRLSSKAPNLQNFPRGSSSMVKNYFMSRYADGVILEFDYKQLEVIVFAFLTQDPALMQDILNGVDIHTELAGRLYKDTFGNASDKDKAVLRQKTKNSTFHVVYGGGAPSLAERVEIPLKTAEEFINIFYDKYFIAKQWQDNLVTEVRSCARYITRHDKETGIQMIEGEYKSITGRLYKPDSFVLKKKGGENIPWISGPSIKNYPVQGLATADIVLLMLGRLWRKSLIHRDKFLLINTVHDSVIIDCKKEFKQFACNFIRNELQLVKEMMKENFKINFNLLTPVDVKVGKSWGEIK